MTSAISKSTAASPLDKLRRLRSALASGEKLPPDDRDFLVDALAGYLDDGLSMDAAFALDRAPGQRDPRSAAKLVERDRHLKTAAKEFMAGAPKAAAARVLATKLDRYYCSGWRHDRLCDECPQHRLGKIEEHFWRALKAWDHGGLSEHSIRRLLVSN